MSGRVRKRNLDAEIRAALNNEDMKSALSKAVNGVNAQRRSVISRFPGYEAARDEARRIQEQAIAELPTLIERFTDAVENHGGTVHMAEDGEQACRVITGIAKERGLKRMVKGKSMTSEEIRLNSALEAAGIAVRETDLGEYILQISGDRPSHIVAPIIHKSVEDVRRAFRDGLGLRDVPHEPAEMTQLARQQLRSDFLAADLGFTGANFLLADTGTVIVVENEGNGRMSTQLPAVHVVLAGVDKLLPAAADLLPFLQLLPRTATGQLLTTYLSFISGPGWAASPAVKGRKREFHVVLLDNGRMKMREDPLLVEALYCIRCGGCMTVCPPYQVLGGHVYGGPTYQSGIGNAWEAGVSGIDTAAEFNELCTTCSRCQDVCPVRIDIPWMNTVLRQRIAERESRGPTLLERWIYDRVLPTDESGSVSLAARLFSDPARVYRLSRSSPWRLMMMLGPTQALVRRLAGLTERRPLPVPAGETLSDWHKRNGGPVASTAHDAERLSDDRRDSTVILFCDCHTENVDTGVGKATVNCLQKCGLTVVAVSGQCCGRAALSQGMLRTATRQAAALQEVLRPFVAAGHSILGVEPSCLSAVVEDHRKLLPDEGTAAVGAGCTDILEFLRDCLRGEGPANAEPLRWKRDAGARRAVLHGHCQQKTLGWLAPAVEVLESIPGLDLQVTQTECCGMAGSFGYKRSYYGVSCELGERLAAEIEVLEGNESGVETARRGDETATPGRARELLACGTSCRAQMADTGRPGARHPIELIAELLI